MVRCISYCFLCVGFFQIYCNIEQFLKNSNDFFTHIQKLVKMLQSTAGPFFFAWYRTMNVQEMYCFLHFICCCWVVLCRYISIIIYHLSLHRLLSRKIRSFNTITLLYKIKFSMNYKKKFKKAYDSFQFSNKQ